MSEAVTKNTLGGITDKRQKFCDNMITSSLESTSCSISGIFELVPPSIWFRGTAPLLPLVSAFSGKQPRGSSF